MLMRYAKVTPEGRYVPPPAANAKASYATMVYVRATIVEDAGWYLARAATIAVRLFPLTIICEFMSFCGTCLQSCHVSSSSEVFRAQHLLVCASSRVCTCQSDLLTVVRACMFLQVRYNAVRRQTAASAGEKELQVLDYQNTSATLLPLVAVAYALIFMVALLFKPCWLLALSLLDLTLWLCCRASLRWACTSSLRRGAIRVTFPCCLSFM